MDLVALDETDCVELVEAVIVLEAVRVPVCEAERDDELEELTDELADRVCVEERDADCVELNDEL